ncbi:hypothetical protein evm_008053 [Chilo suppressalis]|nr:hypothetical protein evm_008053 [Chilo suppressalis]
MFGRPLPVSRIFPKDDSAPAPPGAVDQPLHDVMQETLDVHFQGLVFRERNAGRQIDAHMTDKGFNVQIGVDPETGFPFGGNDANCGTWMDKMGSSEKAGTRGVPATPRDGSAVELVALAYRAAAWLAGQHRAQRYPYPGVVRRHQDGSLTSWTYAAWADRIRAHFERAFWIPPASAGGSAPAPADPRPDLVHRRAIYKDTCGATRAYADYQLRCNCVVAMAVAPDLFDPKRAWLALDNVERLLLGPLGVKTLDPGDWAYRGDYDNSNDGADPSVAQGYNYHQGPEWVWPFGFYVRARLAFAHDNGKLARTVAAGYAALAPHAAELRASPWRGLPELTNAGGAYCADSCRSQAWSSATVLEALHALPRSGALATVVYSDRYFRYGLRLRARRASSRPPPAPAPAPAPAHHIPLLTAAPRRPPPGGALLAVDRSSSSPPGPRRSRARFPVAPPSLFEMEASERFEPAFDDEPPLPRPPPLGYRQPRARIDVPGGRRRDPIRPRPRAPTPPPAPAVAGDAPRPQFALTRDAPASPPFAPDAPSANETKRRSASARNLRRKVLNAERATAAAEKRRRECGRRATGAEARRQRTAVRALLTASGLLYTAALLAFYFLGIA